MCNERVPINVVGVDNCLFHEPRREKSTHLLPAKIEESISILNFFPPNSRSRFLFLPAKFEESISILNGFSTMINT
jgi:hypothetical protein